LKSAQLQNRLWIGIDQSDYAINATKEKLLTIEGDLFSSKPDFEYLTIDDKIHRPPKRVRFEKTLDV